VHTSCISRRPTGGLVGGVTLPLLHVEDETLCAAAKVRRRGGVAGHELPAWLIVKAAHGRSRAASAEDRCYSIKGAN
jgi:hypothetical protein